MIVVVWHTVHKPSLDLVVCKATSLSESLKEIMIKPCYQAQTLKWNLSLLATLK